MLHLGKIVCDGMCGVYGFFFGLFDHSGFCICVELM